MTPPREPMEIGERELLGLTAELEETHRATLPVMREALEEWSAERREADDGPALDVASLVPTRRGFLLGSGVALGALLLAACSDDDDDSSGGNSTDLAVAALAASLENLAVETYQAGIDAAVAGAFGRVPPAVVAFAVTAQAQHRDHAAAWNSALKAAGRKPVRGVDETVKTAIVDPALAQLSDLPGLAQLALDLENVAAATYLNGIGVVKDAGGLKTAAAIQPVEMQHAAILNFVLGQYPVPDAFAGTEGARTTTDKIG